MAQDAEDTTVTNWTASRSGPAMRLSGTRGGQPFKVTVLRIELDVVRIRALDKNGTWHTLAQRADL